MYTGHSDGQKKKMSDVKIANDEVLFIIFYQGRGIINAFGEEIFMSEKEYVMIQGATGRDKISVHAEYPQIMITSTGLPCQNQSCVAA